MENKIKLNAEAFEKLLNIEYYFCRSFVANPDYDRTVGQLKLTTLWQEKIDLCAGTSEVIYQYKNFTPKDLKK